MPVELVKFEEKHKEKLINYLNNKKVTEWLLTLPEPYTEQSSDEWLYYCKQNENGKDNILFGIESGNELVGGIGLHKRASHIYETGYWIGEPHWGKGYATESVKKILDIAFSFNDVIRVQAFVFEENSISEKVLLKCGFEYEGCLLKYHKKNDVFYNSKLYAKVN